MRHVVEACRAGIGRALGVSLLLACGAGCGDEAGCPEGYQLVAGRCVPAEDAGAEGGGYDAGDTPDGCSPQPWYLDSDGDGYGDPAAVTEACERPAQYVDNDEDCDDGDASVYPGATEACNGVDDDCDGETDEGGASGERPWHPDVDGDGYGAGADVVMACVQPEGYADNGEDCDDGDASVYPGATEACNGVDDDCDGETDEEPSADEASLCVDPSTPVCFDASCLCRPQIMGVLGDYELLVPGHAYTLCGTCLEEVNRVRIGGVSSNAVEQGASGCPAGQSGVRITVPSGIGGLVGIYLSVRGQGRVSPRFERVVGELRVNEVKAGYDSSSPDYYDSYVELCAVDPRDRTSGFGALSLRGYWLAVYDDLGSPAGGLHASWSLGDKETAPGGCMVVGRPGNIPATFPAAAQIRLSGSVARFPEYVGGVVVGRDDVAGLSSDLNDEQIVDAVVYDARWITNGIPPASLRNLLMPGASRVVPASQAQSFSTFARCGTYRDNLRDGRAWVVDRPLSLGQFANDCP